MSHRFAVRRDRRRQSQPIVYTKDRLAWTLAELFRSALPPQERAALFVTLGAGDYDEAIVVSLRAAHRRRLDIPEHLTDIIQAWLKTNPVDMQRLPSPHQRSAIIR